MNFLKVEIYILQTKELMIGLSPPHVREGSGIDIVYDDLAGTIQRNPGGGGGGGGGGGDPSTHPTGLAQPKF